MKILLSDDHTMIRKGIKLLLAPSFPSAKIYEATTCKETWTMLIHHEISHLILDITFGDGDSFEILADVVRLYPALHILIFSMYDAKIFAPALRRLGVKEYLSKDTQEDEICRRMSSFLNNDLPRISMDNQSTHPFSILSVRELSLLHYILKGGTPAEIADYMNIKRNTYSTIQSRIFEKTNTKNRKELFDLAKAYNF